MRALNLVAVLAAFVFTTAQAPAPDEGLCKGLKALVKEAKTGWADGKITEPKSASGPSSCVTSPDGKGVVCTFTRYGDCIPTAQDMAPLIARERAISQSVMPTMQSCFPARTSADHQNRIPIGDDIVFLEQGLKYLAPGEPEIRFYQQIYGERSEKGVCQQKSLVVEVLRVPAPE